MIKKSPSKMAPKKSTAIPCAKSDAPLKWHSPNDSPFQLIGFPWFDKEHIYRRLPGKIPSSVGEKVAFIANHTAGGQIRFQTTSTKISIRVTLADSDSMASLGYMPPTGQCGFDLYVGPPKQQVHNWSVFPGDSVLKADHQQELLPMKYESIFADFSEAEYHHCRKGITEMMNATVHFPLYHGVKEVLIGLDPEALITP
ncbi:MAG: SGNH/GDSL hydrolase N-terminal domain-containing protein, partial [Chthoniobacterales bacterium]